MTNEQMIKEIQYKICVQWLEMLKRKGIINDEQFAQIDTLNKESFSPKLKELYS